MATTVQPAEVFRLEAAELMTQLEATLLDLDESPDDRELIDQAFRSLHTLKGSGAMFGWEALAGFIHHIESAFQQVRDGQQAPSRELMALTLSSLDHIHDLLEQPEAADLRRGEALLARYAALSATAPAAAMPETAAATADTAVGVSENAPPHLYRIHWRPAPSLFAFGGNPLLLLDELRDLGPCTVTPLIEAVPPLAQLDPLVCHLAWDIMLTTAAPRQALDDVFIFVAGESELTIEQLPPEATIGPAPRLGQILVERGEVAPADIAQGLSQQKPLGTLLVEAGKTSDERIASALGEQRHRRDTSRPRDASSNANTIRVPAERLDALMDQVGELVIAQARLSQIAAAESNPLLKSIAEDIERLSAELRDTTMGVRMLPIGTLFSRFRRVVHDLSRELGKPVELTMAGEETELDKTVIESLNDPMVHLIRNAMDHGLGTPEQRQTQGRPPEGRLHLSAVHSGAQVLITVEDDGRGLDRVAIRAKAEERGLLQPGQEVSDSELFGCIFLPGFSTAAAVTDISGRGVGLDVVKRAIDGLRGTIRVDSDPARGTAITLKLPLTLAIIDGLLVRIGDERYIVPLATVEECVELSQADDLRSAACSFLNIRGEIVAFVRLRELFELPGQAPPLQKVVIVAAGDARIGLVVDQVLGQHQTVIKSLSRLHDDLEGFSGATIMGDGTVALILDVPHLITAVGEREAAARAA